MDSKIILMFPATVFQFFKAYFPKELYEKDWSFFIKLGRPFLYCYPLLLIYMAFCWIVRLYNPGKFLIPLLFLAFDPMIFSFGLYIGSDLASSSFLLLICYSSWRYWQTKKAKYWFYVSFGFALGVLLKFTFIFLYIIPVLWYCFFLVKGNTITHKGSIVRLFQFIIIQLLVINILYYFTGTFSSLGDYTFNSNALSRIQYRFKDSFLSEIPLLVPTPLLQGIDWLSYNKEYGGCNSLSSYNSVWFWGKEVCDGGIWYYYIGSALFKLPLIVWLAILSLAYYFFRSGNKKILLEKYIFIWLPFLVLLIILSFFNRFQIGFRHAMPLLGLGYIALGFIWLKWYQKRRKVFYILVIANITSLLFYAPNFAAYTNELILKKENVINYMRDASVDYCLFNNKVDRYLEGHPGYKEPTSKPEAGKYIVPIIRVTCKYPDVPVNDLTWLRENFKPVGHYYHSLLIYEVSNEDLDRLKLNNEMK